MSLHPIHMKRLLTRDFREVLPTPDQQNNYASTLFPPLNCEDCVKQMFFKFFKTEIWPLQHTLLKLLYSQMQYPDTCIRRTPLKILDILYSMPVTINIAIKSVIIERIMRLCYHFQIMLLITLIVIIMLSIYAAFFTTPRYFISRMQIRL